MIPQSEDEAAFQASVRAMSLDEHFTGFELNMIRAVFLAGVVRGVNIRDEMYENYRRQFENTPS